MNKPAIDHLLTAKLLLSLTEEEDEGVIAHVNRREWFLYAFGALVALALPLFLIRLQVPFIRLMDEVYHPIVLLQLYTFSAALMLSLLLAGKVWQWRQNHRQTLLPYLLGVLVAFHILALMRQYDARSWDYGCYEEAAKAIVNGTNPYGQCYIYFPTPAQALATGYQFSTWLVGGDVSRFVGAAAQNRADAGWDLVFYGYEATQLLLVLLAFALCYRLARHSGLRSLYAAVLVTALFLLNNPLLATLKHNQVNLWVLDLILLALLGIQRYPLLSGFFVALGAHIKLYPLALLLPWTLKRQWRGLVSAGLGMGAIFLLQTAGGRDLTLWRQFLAFADSFPRGTFFRDNSLHSLVYNTLGHLKWLIGDGAFPVNELHVSRLVLVGMGFLGLLYLWRYMQREQLAPPKQAKREPTARSSVRHFFFGTGSTDSNVRLGHSMDALALALIASPVVWEHHYLLAMPIVIWGAAQARTAGQLWRIAISCFLIFVLPTFDVYPFSYHRLAGLLLLMGTLSPMFLAQTKGTTPQTEQAAPPPNVVAVAQR